MSSSLPDSTASDRATGWNEGRATAIRKDDPLGNAGDAIDFAIDHIEDPFERTDFLDAWREGAVSEWPEYARWLQVQRDGAMQAAQALSNSGAENLVSMLVQAAREREAAARLPDCIPGAEERLNEARAAVVAAMTPHGAHRLPIQEIARPFEERYGEIGAPWESIVQAIAEAVCAVLASPNTGSDELVRRLRAPCIGNGMVLRNPDGPAAADEIERLRGNAITTPVRVEVLERLLTEARPYVGFVDGRKRVDPKSVHLLSDIDTALNGSGETVVEHGEHCSDLHRACPQCLDEFAEWKRLGGGKSA